MRGGLDDPSPGKCEHLRRWHRRSTGSRGWRSRTAPPCVSFPSTVTSILIRASGRVDFLTRVEDDAVHFHRCVGGPPQIIALPGDRTVRQRGRAPFLPRRRRSPPSRCRSRPWARSRGSRPPTAAGTSSASSSPIPCPPDHPLRPSTSPGIATSLLSPELAQTFFIGDGRTSTGRPQRFHPPTGATRLYLGLADAWSFDGPPGFYADNSGSFKVAVRFRWQSSKCRQTFASAATSRLASPLGLAQYPDEHRPKRPVLLAVDQELGEDTALRVAPRTLRSGRRVRSRGASGRGAARRGEHGRGRPGALVSALDFISSHRASNPAEGGTQSRRRIPCMKVPHRGHSMSLPRLPRISSTPPRTPGGSRPLLP